MDTNGESKGRDSLVVKSDISLAILNFPVFSAGNSGVDIEESRDTDFDFKKTEWLVTRWFVEML